MNRRYQIRTVPHSLVVFFNEAVRGTITILTHTYTAIEVNHLLQPPIRTLAFRNKRSNESTKSKIYRDEQLNKERCVIWQKPSGTWEAHTSILTIPQHERRINKSGFSEPREIERGNAESLPWRRRKRQAAMVGNFFSPPLFPALCISPAPARHKGNDAEGPS